MIRASLVCRAKSRLLWRQAIPIPPARRRRSIGGFVGEGARMRRIMIPALVALFVLVPSGGAAVSFEVRALDGSGNNRGNPTWGKANTQYLRVARANYADGIARPVSGPST